MRNNSRRSSYNNRSSRNSSSRYGENSFSNMPRYNYTSEAFDYAHYELTPPERRKKKTSKKKVRYARIREAAPLSMIKTYATIAVIFCFVLSLLCLYASNSNRRTEIANLENELLKAQDDNEYIKISIEDNIDLDKIQSEALKLGLQMPAEYQIVEISVPKDSYAVQYDTEEVTEKGGFWSFFTGLFKG